MVRLVYIAKNSNADCSLKGFTVLLGSIIIQFLFLRGLTSVT